jgi:hypothetical protein
MLWRVWQSCTLSLARTNGHSLLNSPSKQQTGAPSGASRGFMNPTKFDERVVRLVEALNAIPGLYTFSSCGGHEQPTGSQVSRDKFNINFDLQRTFRGWNALALVAFAIQKCSEPEKLSLSPWINSDGSYDPKCLCFELSGRRFADPTKLAQILEVLLVELGGKS